MFGVEYRSRDFKSIIGQPKVVKGLQKYLINGDLPQAISFVGNSGCGKSSISRVLAMSLNCEHPIIDKEKGTFEPCGCCSACKDIIEERFSRGTTVYNGSDVSIDKIREIEENLRYSNMLDKNNIIIFEEAQLIASTAFRSLLTLIESARKDTYFILTSTDKAKFSNSYGSSNATQEKNALRSRLAMFEIKGISTNDISDYLFSILSKIDPDEKLPDEVVDIIPIISKNAKNNLRQALNDFQQAINCEVYDKEGLINLLGYADEEKESQVVLKMLQKDPSAFTYMQNSNDLSGNVPYWAKILTDTRIREVTKIPFGEQWKENSAQMMMATHNVEKLLNAFTKSTSLCGAYFNPTIFYTCICEYYDDNSNSNCSSLQSTTITTTTQLQQKTPIVKKVKKVVKS